MDEIARKMDDYQGKYGATPFSSSRGFGQQSWLSAPGYSRTAKAHNALAETEGETNFPDERRDSSSTAGIATKKEIASEGSLPVYAACSLVVAVCTTVLLIFFFHYSPFVSGANEYGAQFEYDEESKMPRRGLNPEMKRSRTQHSGEMGGYDGKRNNREMESEYDEEGDDGPPREGDDRADEGKRRTGRNRMAIQPEGIRKREKSISKNIMIFDARSFETSGGNSNSSGWMYLEVRTEKDSHRSGSRKNGHYRRGEEEEWLMTKKSYTVHFDMFSAAKTRFKNFGVTADSPESRKKLRRQAYSCCCSVVDTWSRTYAGGEKICTDAEKVADRYVNYDRGEEEDEEKEVSLLLLDCYVHSSTEKNSNTRLMLSIERHESDFSREKSPPGIVDEKNKGGDVKSRKHDNSTSEKLFKKYVVENCFIEF